MIENARKEYAKKVIEKTGNKDAIKQKTISSAPTDAEGFRFIGQDALSISSIWACPVCSSIVDNRQTHKEWHAEKMA